MKIAHSPLTLPPREDAHGFYGTLRSNSESAQAGLGERGLERLWLEAFRQVEVLFRERDQQVVRNFLRSAYGRHLADQVFTKARAHTSEVALRKAIREALAERHYRTNRLIWKKAFNTVKRSTHEGRWTERSREG